MSPWWWKPCVPPKRRFLQESHGVASQKTGFHLKIVIKCICNTILSSIQVIKYENIPATFYTLLQR
jgi:hypothetical protein